MAADSREPPAQRPPDVTGGQTVAKFGNASAISPLHLPRHFSHPNTLQHKTTHSLSFRNYPLTGIESVLIHTNASEIAPELYVHTPLTHHQYHRNCTGLGSSLGVLTFDMRSPSPVRSSARRNMRRMAVSSVVFSTDSTCSPTRATHSKQAGNDLQPHNSS
jgi:hypothetical protein